MVVEQLKEELYEVAQRKLVLEEELKVMNSFINTLQRELELRATVTPKQY